MEYTLPHRTWVTQITCFLVTAIGACAATQAEPGKGYVLTAYADAAGADQLLTGHYSAALVTIRGTKGATADSEVVRETNACVAYVMLRRLPEARTACDRAVTAATTDRSHAKGVVSWSRVQEDSAVATALSNRAIVHALSNEVVGSAEDLAEAHSLAPQSDYVVRNIEAFKRLPGVPGQPTLVARRMND